MCVCARAALGLLLAARRLSSLSWCCHRSPACCSVLSPSAVLLISNEPLPLRNYSFFFFLENKQKLLLPRTEWTEPATAPPTPYPTTKCGYVQPRRGGHRRVEERFFPPSLRVWAADMEEEDGHPENGVHAVKDSDRQQRLRLCVLNEIVNTERDYVRTLLFLQSVSV